MKYTKYILQFSLKRNFVVLSSWKHSTDLIRACEFYALSLLDSFKSDPILMDLNKRLN